MKDFTVNYKQLRKELSDANKPLIFFDDDPDGLASFLLLYRFKQEGRGIVVKSTPKLTKADANKVAEYGPDKVFVLDLPMVEQDFVDSAKVPVIWLDHHKPVKLSGLLYFNPRSYDEGLYYPTSLIAYNIVKQDIWIAAAGVTGDFLVPPFLEEFKQLYPDYVGDQNTPQGLLFHTKLGKLVKVFSMVLKGPTSKVMQCVKILTRIEHPDEIMEQTTDRGKFIWKYFSKHYRGYERLLEEALGHYRAEDRIFLYVYPSDKLSLSADLAMELIYRHPDKIVMVAREKNGEMKLSIRSNGLKIDRILEVALQGLKGYGGGHEYACGANIAQEDFEIFLERFRDCLNSPEFNA
jgi:hypothetical protein